MQAVLSKNAPRIHHRVPRVSDPRTWAGGNYAGLGEVLQIVGEELCETVNLRQGQRVLDVAAGGFHAAAAAVRRWCEVTATDSVMSLFPRRRERVEARALGVCLVDGDPEALPFADQDFDAVLSTFGAMFSSDQERTAAELIRVCRRGGHVALTNWTPDSFIGELSRRLHTRSPGPGGARSAFLSPFLWGTVERLEELFCAYGSVWCARKQVTLHALSVGEWVERLHVGEPPALDVAARHSLRADLLELAASFNRAQDGSMLVDAEYLEVVIRRR